MDHITQQNSLFTVTQSEKPKSHVIDNVGSRQSGCILHRFPTQHTVLAVAEKHGSPKKRHATLSHFQLGRLGKNWKETFSPIIILATRCFVLTTHFLRNEHFKNCFFFSFWFPEFLHDKYSVNTHKSTHVSGALWGALVLEILVHFKKGMGIKNPQ